MITATLYDWLKLLHILAAMVWLGGLVAVAALAAYALRGGEARSVERFVGSLRVVGPLVFLPAMLTVLGLGIWLVLDDDAWGFGQTWTWLALALYAVAFVVGAVFQSRAALGAQRASGAGDEREAVRQLRRWAAGSVVILLVLVVIAWDMVMKPGL